MNTGIPSYEWRLIGIPGTAGRPVKTGEWLAIWNEVEKGFLIHFDRNMGVELGWPDSQRWEDQLADLVWEESKKAAVDYLKSYAAGGGSVDVDRGLRVRLRHRAVMTRI